MSFKEMLHLVELVDKLVLSKTGKHLSDIHRAIIQQILEGKRLNEVKFLRYQTSSIQREYAQKLWRLLEQVTGEQSVGVINLQTILEKLQDSDLVDATQIVSTEEVEFEAIAETNKLKSFPKISTEQVLFSGLESEILGRGEAIAHLYHLLKQGAKIILIQAPGGMGKTAFARQFLKYLKSRKFQTIEYQIAKEPEDITPVEIVIEEWLRYYFKDEPGREFGIMKARLKQKLQHRQIAILIDHLESTLDGQGRFIEKHRNYLELLQILAHPDVRSITLITSREFIYENVNIYNYTLPNLTPQIWEEFLINCNIKLDAKTLKELYKIYGGNALAMRVLSDAIIRYNNGDITSYWQEHKTTDGLLIHLAVENIIKEQFNRLQKLSPNIYKLLCRLGCYRYQDVWTIPIEGLLALLWDIPEEKQHRYIIESLRNSGLIEYEAGEFWLLPVIREEAIARLKSSQDWEITNYKAAEFWTESAKTMESIQDAVTAFEAYYHYLNVNDLQKAASVIAAVF